MFEQAKIHIKMFQKSGSSEQKEIKIIIYH